MNPATAVKWLLEDELLHSLKVLGDGPVTGRPGQHQFAVVLADGRTVYTDRASAHVDVYQLLPDDLKMDVVGAGYVVDGRYVEGGDLGKALKSGDTIKGYYPLGEDCEVNWDRQGIGGVPNQVDVAYFGFTRPMTAAKFRALVPAGASHPGTTDQLKPLALRGEPIAPPFLIVKWDEKAREWQVLDHEGRSRSRLVCDDDEVPVDILPRGLRARDLTPEMLAAPLRPQR